MMTPESQYKPLKNSEHLTLLLIFGSIFLYFLVGALNGQIYLPAKHGQGGTYIEGIYAWFCLLTPTMLYLVILVRHQEIGYILNDKLRTVLEFTLLIGGLALLVFATRHGYRAC